MKNLAKLIAKQELIIQNSQDDSEIEKAKEEIMQLSRKVGSLEELAIVDDYVMDFLKST